MPNSSQTKVTNIPAKSKTKSRINKRQRNRRRNKQKSLNNNQQKGQFKAQTNSVAFSESGQRKGTEIWGEAYANAVRWHGEHQNNFWRHAAEQLENENQMLRQQLNYVANSIKPETQNYYETSDEEYEQKDLIVVKKEEEQQQEDEVDSKYLEFLQVTIKHREELRLKREAADLLEDQEDSTTGDVG
ncbi:uncharacterized protein LOC129951001 [Eupeodes corollae]|uniref:uncharacterized protein LOC129951001 n=1 Tax=Eupeodes corollae TaxID=290404 RepID=UPI0024907821|nr:uncharacterized protein LOC129951001 [Eupeodes corollae]